MVAPGHFGTAVERKTKKWDSNLVFWIGDKSRISTGTVLDFTEAARNLEQFGGLCMLSLRPLLQRGLLLS